MNKALTLLPMMYPTTFDIAYFGEIVIILCR